MTRLNAYVLLADPSWLRASVRSYYPHVGRIVACFDEEGVGWRGGPIPVDRCREILEEEDVDGKIEYLPGAFSMPDAVDSMVADTAQRQVALDAAGEGADWVLQLDADEIIPHWPTFERWLRRVEALGYRSLWYPQRWLFSRVGRHVYFEGARQLVRTSPARPGPLAVRAGARLVHARQDDTPRLLIDIGPGRNAVRKRHAVIHLSWVRSAETLLAKSSWSGHADYRDWSPELRAWFDSQRHPVRFQIRNLLTGEPYRLRPAFLWRVYADEHVPHPAVGTAAAARVPGHRGRDAHG